LDWIDFQKENMAVNSDNIDGYVGGDQREKDLLSPIENKHYDLINEKGDSTSTKSDMRGATKDMIIKESERNMIPSSESAMQSSHTLSTIISTGDNLEENSKTKSTESSDNEIIIIDGGKGQCCIYISYDMYLFIHIYCKQEQANIYIYIYIYIYICISIFIILIF